MLLIQFLFRVQIVEIKNRLSRVDNELKVTKVEAKEEEARMKVVASKKEEEAKRLNETTKDMVAKWWKDGGQGCSKDVDAPPSLIIYVLLYIFIWMNNAASWWKMIVGVFYLRLVRSR
jgi:hypothetical protein